MKNFILYLIMIITSTYAFSVEDSSFVNKPQAFHNKTPIVFNLEAPKHPTDRATTNAQTLTWLDIPLMQLPDAYTSLLNQEHLSEEQKKAAQKIARSVIQNRLNPVIKTINEEIIKYQLLALHASKMLQKSPTPKDLQLYITQETEQFFFDALHVTQSTKYKDLQNKYENFKNHFQAFLTPSQINFDYTDFINDVEDRVNKTPTAKTNFECCLNILIDVRNAHHFDTQQYCNLGGKMHRLGAADDWKTVKSLEYKTLKNDAFMFFDAKPPHSITK